MEWLKEIYVKGLPFKIIFFLWRIWKKRLARDDNLWRMRMSYVLRCYCCEEYAQKIMEHLFLTPPIAQKLREYFASCAGINIHGQHLKQLITKWWDFEGPANIQIIFKVIPEIVLWELWKRKNSRRHGKEVSLSRMIHQCQLIIN